MTDDETFQSTQSTPVIDRVETSIEKTDKTWAMLCHLSSFLFFVVPFGNIIAPLVIWLAKREDDEAVNVHGSASLNFQITIFLLMIATGLVAVMALVFLGLGTALSAGNLSVIFASFAAISMVVLLGIFFGFLSLWTMALVILNGIRAYDSKAPWYMPLIPFLGPKTAPQNAAQNNTQTHD